MFKYRRVIHKYRVWFSIASFIFIGIPQYIDSIWSLYQKINNMENAGLNITWLYAITAPIGLALLGITFWLSRKPLDNNDVAWGVYDNLVTSFRELMFEDDKKKRADIRARIEIERGKLPDKTLDGMINLFLDAEEESNKVGLNPINGTSQYMLSLNNERMRNYIHGKYGGK